MRATSAAKAQVLQPEVEAADDLRCFCRWNMDYTLQHQSTRRKVAVLVSKMDHCLWDLLIRHKEGTSRALHSHIHAILKVSRQHRAPLRSIVPQFQKARGADSESSSSTPRKALVSTGLPDASPPMSTNMLTPCMFALGACFTCFGTHEANFHTLSNSHSPEYPEASIEVLHKKCQAEPHLRSCRFHL